MLWRAHFSAAWACCRRNRTFSSIPLVLVRARSTCARRRAFSSSSSAMRAPALAEEPVADSKPLSFASAASARFRKPASSSTRLRTTDSSSRHAATSGRSWTDIELFLQCRENLRAPAVDLLVAKGALRMTERQSPRHTSHSFPDSLPGVQIEQFQALEEFSRLATNDLFHF